MAMEMQSTVSTYRITCTTSVFCCQVPTLMQAHNTRTLAYQILHVRNFVWSGGPGLAAA